MTQKSLQYEDKTHSSVTWLDQSALLNLLQQVGPLGHMTWSVCAVDPFTADTIYVSYC